MPARLEGREAIRQNGAPGHGVAAAGGELRGGRALSTQDPEVVIAEMRERGTVTTTGRSFAAASVQILRIRDGHIVLFRDFADPRVLADVIGEPRPGR
jgi:uncharacterized protein